MFKKLVILFMVLTSCSSILAAQRKSLDKSSYVQIRQVLSDNDNLHSAFFKYDASEVESLAKVLAKSIKKIDNEELLGKLKFSATKLEEIKQSKSKEENYQSYHLVSMALIHIVNTYDVGKEYNAYSCPMVKKKWLQNSVKKSKLQNPYDNTMPHCGTQDTKY